MFNILYRIRALPLALLLTSGIGGAAFASSLPDIPAAQIAADVQRQHNAVTGQVEYIARDFDPFEDAYEVAGSARLRSASSGIAIDGQHVSGGAYLDINALYTSDSVDEWDRRGFERAVFMSGEPVNFMSYDVQTLKCDNNTHSVTYERDYYAGASYGFIGGLYRLYPHYRGHSNYRWRNRFYDWRGYRTHSRRDVRRHGDWRHRHDRDRDHRDDGRRHRDMDRDDMRHRDDRNSNRDRAEYRDRDRDRSDRDRSERRDGDRNRNGNGRARNHKEINGNNDFIAHRRWANRGGQTRNRDRNRDKDGQRSGSDQSSSTSTTIQSNDRQAIYRPQRGRNDRRDRTITSNTQQTRSVTRRDDSTVVMQARETIITKDGANNRDRSRRNTQNVTSRNDRVNRMRQEVRQRSHKATQPTNARTRKGPSSVSIPKSRPSSQPKASSRPKSSSRPASSSRPKSSSSNKSRSTSVSRSKPSNQRSTSRSVDRSFKGSNPRSKGRENRRFFPMVGGYARTDIYVRSRCTKEETLTVHIPQDRLEAARFDGLVIVLIDNAGTEQPVYIPPNYIEGFRQASTSGLYSHPIKNGHVTQFPPASSREPIIYGNPGEPVGRYPQ